METKILIADDHQIVVTGTSLILESKIDNVIIGVAENYLEVIDKIKRTQYNLLILDINMPEGKNKKMISEIKQIDPNIKILIFSAYEESVGFQYILEGADGYINKLCKVEDISDAVQKMLTEGRYYSKIITDYLLKASRNNFSVDPLENLSDREFKIFNLMAKGYGNLEISNALNIQTSTVSTYKKRIYSKLGTANIAQLIEIHKKYSNE